MTREDKIEKIVDLLDDAEIGINNETRYKERHGYIQGKWELAEKILSGLETTWNDKS